MKRIINSMRSKNIGCAYLYFYIHFVVEVLCFFVLAKLIGDSPFLWMAPLFYDMFAFAPQAVIGYISDKIPSFNVGFVGVFFLLSGFILFGLNLVNPYISILLICLGNGSLHVEGAEVTLRCSEGKLSHSAIFVSGGSFGVITGKLLGTSSLSFWFLVFLGLSMIPFIMLADTYKKDALKEKRKYACASFDYASKKMSGLVIIVLAVLVVIVRGYMGYGLPTSWNKTIWQTVLLYFAMGFGKALGGILSDSFGIKKVGIVSSLLALPFLLCGDNLMVVSLIGVLLFSMTMSITLALLVSVLKDTPGLAFGLTTIGLFLGTVPIFFFKLTTFWTNSIVIIFFTIVCAIIFVFIIRKDESYE